MIPRSTWRSWYIYIRQTKSLNYILPMLIALLGAAHIYFRTSNYGPNVTGDTLTYISVAENLASGNGFVTYNQFRFQTWPPFFPILLAFFAPLGIDLVDIGRFINVIGFGIILAVLYSWLFRYLRNQILIVITMTAMVLSYPLNFTSSYLLTETLFITFSLLALIKLSLFIQSTDLSRSDLNWAAIFTAFAVTTRYLGSAIILTGIVIILIRSGFSTLREKFKYIVIYTTISSIPLGVWFYRNFLVTGHPTGIRTIREAPTLTDRLSESYDVLYQWVWFDSSKNILQTWVVVIIVILALIGLSASRKSSDTNSYPSSRLGSSHKTHARWKVALPFGLFLTIYLAIILIGTSVASGSGGVDHAINTRYMAPIYIPALIVITIFLDYLLQQTGRFTVMSWAIICPILFVLINSIAISLQRNFDETSAALADDAKITLWGYSSDSETMKFLRNDPVNGQIYSNENPAIYWFAFPNASASSTPEYVLPIPAYTDRESCLSWIKSLVSPHNRAYILSPHTRAYIVYFHEDRPMSCPIPEFVPELLPYINGVTRTSEATIYQMTESSTLGFDVQVDAKTITYTKNPCNSENTDTSARFLLHIVPVDKNYLLINNPFDNPFDTMDFDFANHGVMSGNECTIRLGLPEYDISEIYTGQLADRAVIWETTITPSTYVDTYDDNGATETVTSAPGAPSGFSAISDNDWIILSWNDPGDPSITNYQIREQPSYDQDWWCWSTLSGDKRTVHRIDGLPQNTTFRIQLRALNAAGVGPSSEVLVSTADVSSPVSVPDAPAGLSGTPGNESIVLNWEDPNDNTIVEYQTREFGELYTDWGCWRRRGPSPGATLSLPGLSNDRLYRIRLRALNAAGTSPVSQTEATPTSVPPNP